MVITQERIFCVRTGLSVHGRITRRNILCQDWSVSVWSFHKNEDFVPGQVCQRMVISGKAKFCVRTGLSVYSGSAVFGYLCHDWSVSVLK